MLSSLILDALFPDACLACLAPKERGSRHDLACDDCLRSIALPDQLACQTCGDPAPGPVPSCHGTGSLVLAPAESRVVGTLAGALLYEGLDRAAHPLAELLAAAAAGISVPLHRCYAAPLPTPPAELRERGYDANLLLARGFAALLGLPLAEHLLTVSRRGGLLAYGIGTPGDAASANLVVLVGVHAPRASAAARCAALAGAACPHAGVVLASCTD